jgi:transcriptional regulator with XRE-family HTH domain
MKRKADRRTLLLKGIGLRIQELRIARDLSQANLAERVGVDTQTIQRAERGRVSLALEKMERIAGALEVPMSSLFEPVGGEVGDRISTSEWQAIQDLRRLPADRLDLALRLIRECKRGA